MLAPALKTSKRAEARIYTSCADGLQGREKVEKNVRSTVFVDSWQNCLRRLAGVEATSMLSVAAETKE